MENIDRTSENMRKAAARRGRLPGRYLVEVGSDWYRLWPSARAEFGDILAISIDDGGDLSGLEVFRDGQPLDCEADGYPAGDELLALIEDACLGELRSVDALYSVSYGAAGCLPDSDSYPYVVVDLVGARGALEYELGSMLEPPADLVGEDAIRDLVNDLEAHGSIAVPDRGTYSLTIEVLKAPF